MRNSILRSLRRYRDTLLPLSQEVVRKLRYQVYICPWSLRANDVPSSRNNNFTFRSMTCRTQSFLKNCPLTKTLVQRSQIFWPGKYTKFRLKVLLVFRNKWRRTKISRNTHQFGSAYLDLAKRLAAYYQAMPFRHSKTSTKNLMSSNNDLKSSKQLPSRKMGHGA